MNFCVEYIEQCRRAHIERKWRAGDWYAGYYHVCGNPQCEKNYEGRGDYIVEMCTEDIPEPFTAEPYNPIDRCGLPRFERVAFLPLPHQLDISFDDDFYRWRKSNAEWIYEDDDSIQLAFKYFMHTSYGRVWNGRQWVVAPIKTSQEAPKTETAQKLQAPDIYIGHVRRNRLAYIAVVLWVVILGLGIYSATRDGEDMAERININTASAKELTAIPTIGDVIAGRIVEHRERNGAFKNEGDLREVEGIGKKKAQIIMKFIVFE